MFQEPTGTSCISLRRGCTTHRLGHDCSIAVCGLNFPAARSAMCSACFSIMFQDPSETFSVWLQLGGVRCRCRRFSAAHSSLASATGSTLSDPISPFMHEPSGHFCDHCGPGVHSSSWCFRRRNAHLCHHGQRLWGTALKCFLLGHARPLCQSAFTPLLTLATMFPTASTIRQGALRLPLICQPWSARCAWATGL